MAKNPDKGSRRESPPAAGRPLPVQTVSTPEGDLSISFTPRAESDDPGAGAPPTAASTAQAAPGTRFAAADSGGDGTDGTFFKQLTGIPIEYLVATPLMAAARSNMALAQVMAQFIDELGYEKKKDSDAAGGDVQKTRTVKFELTRNVQDPDSKAFKPQTITVEAPLLALVPIPALLIQSVNVNLTVEVSQTITKNNSSSESVNASASAGWGFGNVSVTGTYSNSESRARSTNQSAKYEINVTAQQQTSTEGMSKLMDVFASTITPIVPVTS